MKTGTKLLPCPFCGNEARVKAMRSGEDSMDTWVECTGCFVRTDPVDAPYSEPELAAHAWNDRIDYPDPERRGEM